jgi:hypothetical protein
MTRYIPGDHLVESEMTCFVTKCQGQMYKSNIQRSGLQYYFVNKDFCTHLVTGHFCAHTIGIGVCDLSWTGNLSPAAQHWAARFTGCWILRGFIGIITSQILTQIQRTPYCAARCSAVGDKNSSWTWICQNLHHLCHRE